MSLFDLRFLPAISAATAISLAWPSLAQADEPLPPASTTQFNSPNKRFIAVSDPDRGTAVVESSSGRVLWRMPGWFRSLHVSDGGETVVAAASNLIPLDAGESFELLVFWHRGQKVKVVTLADIVPDRDLLVRTVSHYAWGDVNGIDAKGRLQVTRVDGKVFRFNMETGQPE